MLQPNSALLHASRPSLRRAGASRAIFWWAVVAVCLQFVLTTNLLQAAGVTIPIKVHPSSIIVLLCVIALMARGDVPLQTRFRASPSLMLFVFGIPLLALYATVFNGYSGSMVYIESFWSAGLLTIVLEAVPARRQRQLAQILIAFCMIDAVIGIYESLSHTNWFPFVIDPDLTEKLTDTDVDFRANAFYGHPLTASLVTAMAIFLVYSMRLRFLAAGLIFTVLLVALLAFGGRTALGVTLVVSAAYAVYTLLAGIVRRDLKLDFVMGVVVAAILVPIVVAVIVTETSIAERIMDTLYYDDSAEVRSTQWAILGRLSLRNWLFGISMQDLSFLKYQIGLGSIDTDIENFWLLTFLNLGSIAFIPFLGLFAGYLVHMARRTRSLNGWLLMVSALVIDSTSNSLGVRSNDLFLEAAFLAAMIGYVGYVRAPRPRMHGRSSGRWGEGGIAAQPQRAIFSGLRASSPGASASRQRPAEWLRHRRPSP